MHHSVANCTGRSLAANQGKLCPSHARQSWHFRPTPKSAKTNTARCDNSNSFIHLRMQVYIRWYHCNAEIVCIRGVCVCSWVLWVTKRLNTTCCGCTYITSWTLTRSVYCAHGCRFHGDSIVAHHNGSKLRRRVISGECLG